MNGSKLANLKVPFPIDISIQAKIVERLDALNDKLQLLKKEQRETEKEMEQFSSALLSKAFQGEL